MRIDYAAVTPARGMFASKWGRLSTFFLLYVTEGIPLGFAAVAIAAQMRRAGVGPAQIGLFIASFYFPWSFKWAAGPVVDLVYSERLGRRRAWIVGCQLAMMLTLLVAMPVDFSAQLKLFTAILLVHNCFAAVQDVAIDALAVSVLRDDERGLANGLMFAGANVGQAIGGSGVLYLSYLLAARGLSFNYTFFAVVAAIASVTFGVAIRLREPPVMALAGASDPAGSDRPAVGAWTELRRYATTAFGAMFGSKPAFAALVLALLPAGAHALGLALQSNLGVELGLTDDRLATLSLISSVSGALGCVAGGFLSDRFGRRKMFALYVVTMAVPNVALAYVMQKHGWVMPVNTTAATRPAAPAELVRAFWIATIAYSLFMGLMYGTRSALFMDVCNPLVAATQFTAYMGLLNLVISYSATWQGFSAEKWGYPTTLLLDATFGLVCLIVLPFVRRPAPPEPQGELRGFPVVAAEA